MKFCYISPVWFSTDSGISGNFLVQGGYIYQILLGLSVLLLFHLKFPLPPTMLDKYYKMERKTIKNNYERNKNKI